MGSSPFDLMMVGFPRTLLSFAGQLAYLTPRKLSEKPRKWVCNKIGIQDTAKPLTFRGIKAPVLPLAAGLDSAATVVQ